MVVHGGLYFLGMSVGRVGGKWEGEGKRRKEGNHVTSSVSQCVRTVRACDLMGDGWLVCEQIDTGGV